MNNKHLTKLIREGQYIAEVEIELIDVEKGWSPYLSIEDAYKLDDVRAALQRGNIRATGKFGRVYTLTPLTV